jgi:flavin reductase (DIM6/NTAB) family NADH-FMN oxidoreductase RutF
MEPRLILVSLQDSNHLPHMIKKSKHFGVSILATGQEEISGHFSTSGRDPGKELGPGIRTLIKETGSPLIEGAIGMLDCELESALPGGDHTIVVGRVVAATFDPSKLPLMYVRRAYRTLNMD